MNHSWILWCTQHIAQHVRGATTIFCTLSNVLSHCKITRKQGVDREFAGDQERTLDVASLVPLLENLGYPTHEAALKEHFTHFMAQQGHGVAVAVLKVNCVLWPDLCHFSLYQTPRDFTSKAFLWMSTIEAWDRRTTHGARGRHRQSNSPAVVDLASKHRERSHKFYRSLGYKNEGPTEKVYLRKMF